MLLTLSDPGKSGGEVVAVGVVPPADVSKLLPFFLLLLDPSSSCSSIRG
jgi:hypothetical protein